MIEIPELIRSEDIGKIVPALLKAQSQMEAASKDAKNPHFGSKYADYASVIDGCKKPLNDNGILITHIPQVDGGGIVSVTTLLMHESGEFMGCRLMVTSDGRSQSVGSAISYLKRYGLQPLIALPSDDDDGEAAMGRPQMPQRQPEQQRQMPGVVEKKPPAQQTQPQPVQQQQADPHMDRLRKLADRVKLPQNQKFLTYYSDFRTGFFGGDVPPYAEAPEKHNECVSALDKALDDETMRMRFRLQPKDLGADLAGIPILPSGLFSYLDAQGWKPLANEAHALMVANGQSVDDFVIFMNLNNLDGLPLEEVRDFIGLAMVTRNAGQVKTLADSLGVPLIQMIKHIESVMQKPMRREDAKLADAVIGALLKMQPDKLANQLAMGKAA